MSKFRFVKFSVFLICLLSLNVFGQRKEISKEEYSSANKNAAEKLKTMSVRTVSKIEVYSDNDLKSTQSNISEFIPPDKRHTVFEAKMFDIGRTMLMETIGIGGEQYKSENGGDWVKATVNLVNEPSKNPIKTVENNSKFYLTENVQFNNQTADLYEIAVESKVTIPGRTSNQTNEIISHRTEKHWISNDGLPLRLEIEDESQQSHKFISRRVWTYEYDPNIKIEAPVVKTENKN